MVPEFSRLPEQVISAVDGPGGLAPLRRRVRAMLAGAPEKDVVDAVLVANEIATIAWLTVGHPFTVRLLKMSDGTLRTEVTTADPPEDVGRSGELLDGLASRWGVQPRRDGATIWADVMISAAPERVRVTTDSDPVHQLDRR